MSPPAAQPSSATNLAPPRFVSTIRETIAAIGTQWFLESGQEPAARASEAPDFFERYTEEFDPCIGMGGMEIWIPVKP